MLNRDFNEFIQSLNANDVHYLVIGGYALAVHGCPRYTKDIDVWVDSVEDNADRLIKALNKFGFGSLGLLSKDFSQPDRVVQLGYPPSRIDILTFADGLEFNQCYPNKVVVDINGTPVNFLDIDNLIRNKKASGRLQDLADVESLEKMQKPETE